MEKTLNQIKQEFKVNYNNLAYLDGLLLQMIELWNTRKDSSAYTVFSDLDDRILELRGKE